MRRLFDTNSWSLLPLLVAAGACTDREAHAQVSPDPTPPGDVGDIDATRTAPDRGEIPQVAGEPGTGPADFTREGTDVIVITGGQIGVPTESAEPFYYPPIEQGPQISELYQASRMGGGPAGPPAGAGEPQVSCAPELEPVDLAAQARELEELEDAAVGAEYKANLREAAEMLEDASVEVRRETEQLEQAVARADRIAQRAMELATETDDEG